MALADMKMSKAQSKERMAVPTSLYEEYPYGLRLSLDSDAMKKLGLSAKNFDVKDAVTIVATGRVVSMSSSQSAGDKQERSSLDIQIEKLEVSKKTASKMERVNSMKKEGPK